MFESPRATHAPDFPVRTVTLGIMAMIALLVVSTFLSWRVGNQIRAAMDSQVKVLTDVQKVEHYGAMLEYSIKAVINQRDAEAAAEFRRIQPELRKTLASLQAEVDDDEARAAAGIDQLDQQMVAMEYRALALAKQGRIAEARRVIYSRRYDYLREGYIMGVRRIEANAGRYLESSRRQLNVNVRVIVAMSGASLILMIVGWLALIIPTRRWGKQLNRARKKAERSAGILEDKHAELEQLNLSLFNQARTDPLTGTHTRLKFNEDLADLWPRVLRKSTNVCAMMCDIDHFKQYNDSFGHAAGDDALRRVAAAINGMRRGGDQLYRMGGEEFLVLLHDCTPDQAALRAEDYRAAVEGLAISHSSSPLGFLTMSVGVAALCAGGCVSLHDCLTAADEAMYEAKARGRNAVFSSARMAA